MNNTAEIKINDFVFDCRISGNKDDQLVILLHGFPESSFMWIDLMQDISALGFYCIAPNMRGYSEGARPKGKQHYTIDKLCQDVLDIAKFVGKEKFHLIAHDWGAVIGWKTVYDNPKAILSWTALSIPHIKALSYAIANDAVQKKKSQYVKNFQVPFLPEMQIRKNDFELFRKLWKHSSEEEVEDYLFIFRNKKALTAALNYYRANYQFLRKLQIGNINVPTLFIWGEHDLAIGAYGVEYSHKYMKSYYKFVKLDAGHWLIQSRYEDIKTEIIEHLLKFKVKITI